MIAAALARLEVPLSRRRQRWAVAAAIGLPLLEAMACGTPVVAFRHGSVPEVLEEGVSGFVVDSMEDAIEAARRIGEGELDRSRVRAAFEQRFSADRMAKDYLELYAELAARKSDDALSSSEERAA